MAHIKRDADGRRLSEQTIAEHCCKAAQYAAEVLKPLQLSGSGYVAGLLHDTGKFTQQFQDYLENENGVRGSVNHTFAGVRFLLERYHHEPPEELADIAVELLALAVGEHHGLWDCVNDQQKNGFQHRLTKEGIGYEEAMKNFFHFCTARAELEQRLQGAQQELTPVLEKILAMTSEDSPFFDDETAFYSGLLARLLLSAVIEGDRRDTAEFMNEAQFPVKRSDEAMERLWTAHLHQMEEKLDQLPQDSPIDRARRAISDQCRQAAEQPGGIFRLNVPTGGGKTLSSLRYALAHAGQYKKQRIIFTSPLLSILDQNAKEIRDYIQDDSLILEHHSNLIRTEEDGQQLDKRELLVETWAPPIILTTLVQLLNTLFSGKITAIRRFHALCNSVIVIDEVQTVPSKMLTLFSLAINFLTEICGTTVVLCSATQPCMEQIEHPLHTPIVDLVPYDPDLWNVFRRTEIQDGGVMPLAQIAGLALTQLETADSLLIVCNTKEQARQLYDLLKQENLCLFFLSAAMCVAHRRDTLDKLKNALKQSGQKIVCVSTQVIEAGVDISFSCVIRLCAGMDSVVQAAGRCNRNGEAGSGIMAPVYVVQCQNESLTLLPDIQRSQEATRELLSEFANHPVRYGGRLDSDEAIGYYYRALFRKVKTGHHDFCVKERPSLFSLLSMNEHYAQERPYYFNQAFRLAGSLFEVFDENTTDVVVPYGPGAELIQKLSSEQLKYNPKLLKKTLEQVKPYTISLYLYQIDHLNAEHSLIPLQGGVMGLSGHYNAKIGFSLEETNLEFLWR